MQTPCFYNLKNLLLTVLIILTGVMPAVVQGQSGAPIPACRQQAIDETGFIECLTLALEQSERALVGIEESWRLELADDQLAVEENLAATAEQNSDSVALTIDEAESPRAQSDETQPGLIAIVGGQAGDDSSVAGTRVINVDNEANTEARLAAEGIVAPDAAVQAQRFSSSADLYREYRDQRCQWQAGLTTSNQIGTHYQACLVTLNREREQRLRRLLAEKRASDIGGESFRGYFVRTGSGGVFQSCDHRQDWWVTGSEEAVQSLIRRYDDITSESLEMVYVEFRAHTAPAVSSGPGADFAATVELSALNLMRPIYDQDCGSVKTPAGGQDGENQSLSEQIDADLAEGDVDSESLPRGESVTVDDLGDAGFYYGYFSDWRSACAIGQLAVCRAQTNTDYSTEDAWVLSVDRSSLGDWRLQLLPTTENISMGRLLQMTVDDNHVSTIKIPNAATNTNHGVLIAAGSRALTLLDPMRSGQSLGFDWIKPDQTSAKLSFSLVGVTRALKYFDQAEK